MLTPAAQQYLNKKLIITHQHGIKFIALAEIVYLEADNVYTTIILADGYKLVTSKPIHKYESLLDVDFFFRIHKSYIINLYHFKEYVTKEGEFVVMNNGVQLTIAKARMPEFLASVKRYFGSVVL